MKGLGELTYSVTTISRFFFSLHNSLSCKPFPYVTAGEYIPVMHVRQNLVHLACSFEHYRKSWSILAITVCITGAFFKPSLLDVKTQSVQS